MWNIKMRSIFNFKLEFSNLKLMADGKSSLVSDFKLELVILEGNNNFSRLSIR